ncbi:hypothetical protein JCM10207_002904 [Rhodosporidiobolus poonsookiae]
MSNNTFSRPVELAGSGLPYDVDPYGYGIQGPSLTMNAVFVAFFAVSGLVHLAQLFISRRYWWMAVMPIGGAIEVLGWSARVWSHFNLPSDGFIIQICVLVLAPTFYSAAIYWAGGVILADVAPSRSWISGKWFKISFVTADVVSLVIQGIGGGMAGSAAGEKPAQLEAGSNIMLAGIIVQLVIMIVFSAYMAAWTWYARSEVRKAGTRMQVMLVALAVSSIAIIIRGGYRTAELDEGFRGELALNESMILLDAIPVLICTYILNIVHPHWFLRVSPAFSAASSRDSQLTMVPAERGAGAMAEKDTKVPSTV